MSTKCNLLILSINCITFCTIHLYPWTYISTSSHCRIHCLNFESLIVVIWVSCWCVNRHYIVIDIISWLDCTFVLNTKLIQFDWFNSTDWLYSIITLKMSMQISQTRRVGRDINIIDWQIDWLKIRHDKRSSIDMCTKMHAVIDVSSHVMRCCAE